VSLTVDVSGPAVTVETTNDAGPPAADPDRTGHGLIGMRERAAAAGGRLEVSRDSGHFRVRAELPAAERALR
jgi:signal transduction histidine kinase